MQPATPATVLLVEDNEDLRDVLATFLASRGYRVIAREDVPGALAALREQRPDLVVTDIFLGATSGLDLIAAIRQEPEPHPAIIACSAVLEVDRTAVERGADLFLPKPLEPRTFEQALAALLAKRAPSRDLLAEHTQSSFVLRAQQVNAAREAAVRLEPHRTQLTRQAAQDMHWLATFLGFGTAIMAFIRGERLLVGATSDPSRWPAGRDLGSDLPLTRHIVETGSSFVVPDLQALLPHMVSPVGAPRFVAGFPLRYGEVPVGVVCLLDEQPGQLDQADFGFMQALCGVISAVVSGIETPPRRDSLLMRRRALEAVLRSEFDRAARLNLTVHLFVFSSSTPPPYLFAERTLIAELGDGSFGMVVTRDSRDRSPPDLVSTIQRLSALPGFGTGNLVSIEMRAAPRIEADYVLHIAERRVVERADPDGAIHRIVVHVEPLAGLNPFGPRVTSASSST